MALSSTLAAYLARRFVVTLLVALLVVSALLVLFDVVELTRATGSQAVALDAVLRMAGSRLPMSLQNAFPFLFMGAALMQFWRLSRSGEWVILRAAGLSVWQILAPVLAVVLVAGVLAVTLFNPFAAALYGRFEQLEAQARTGDTVPVTISKNGLWLREARDGDLVVLHAEALRQQGDRLDLTTVTLFLFDDGSRFDHRIDAASGVLRDGTLTLVDAAISRPGQPLDPRATLQVPTSLSLPQVRDSFSAPETVSFWDLGAFIAFSEASGFTALPHRLHRQALLASPVMLVAMVLVGAVFAMGASPRGANWLLRVVGALAAGFAVFFFSKVTYTLGLSETLPPMLAAWAPALVTTFAALALLLHLEEG